VKEVAGLADRVRPPTVGLVVLIYHRVGRRAEIEIDLSTELFAEQMAELASRFRVVTLDEGLTLLGRPDLEEAPRPVVVTFDDGTVDFVEEALPVLDRFSVPATLFVATGFVEDQRTFPDAGRPLTWSALDDACATGLVTIGSHTHTHRLLDRATADETADELDRSCGLVEERLGVEAAHFAYPKALPGNPEADGLVRRRFRSASLAGTRPNAFAASDVFALARSPVQQSDGMRFFRRKAEGGMAAEDRIRQVANRLRYRGRAT
jgi:peptidoglycan/xylan/chitin deacetylase (PgdA/CDA1 family)